MWAMGAAFLGAIVLAAPAQAMGQRHYQEGAIETGTASWYGSDNGRTTASGMRFDPRQYTAAHRHLPFGTIVRVTNLSNGLAVQVMINDRGPWAAGRIIDLSSAAADALKMKSAGTAKVTIEVIQLGPPVWQRP
jgi:rare lipoprotein A